MKSIELLLQKNWSSWQTGFDVKHLYNHGHYFVDRICQENPQMCL